jgi:hypothetical protein
VAHPQTDGGRIAPSSFLFHNKATHDGAKETDSSSFSSTPSDSGKRPRATLDTSALFLIWNAAANIAASYREKEEEKQTLKGSGRGEAAAAGTGRERERKGSGRVAKASGESSQGGAAGRTAGHRLARQLHTDESCHLRTKQRTTSSQQKTRRSRRRCRRWRRGDADVGADGANFAATDAHSIILAIAQVTAAAAEHEIMFNKVESAPMARFHGIGQVFPDALYGHIIVTFDVVLLRLQIKELQEGIAYRQNRATPEHRDLYDVLEENLMAGNQELEGNMDFFTTLERKERTFGEWITGVLGLWNVVQIHEVKKMVEGTKRGLMLEVHLKDALRDYAEATQDDLGKLAKRILEQTNFLWSRMEQISSKAAVNDALRPITAIGQIATTITDHRLDRAVMDLVNVPNLFSE